MKAVLRGFLTALGMLFLPVYIFAQNHTSAVNSGLAFASEVTNSNYLSAFNNPASIVNLSTHGCGINYSPSPFGLKELSTVTAGAVYNLPNISFSVGYSRYGYELYNENNLLIGVGYAYLEMISLGLTLKMLNVNIQNYGSASTAYPLLGASIMFTPAITMGVSLSNPLNQSISESAEQIPVVMNVGVKYTPISNSNIYFAMQKEKNFVPSFRFGVEYRIIKFLALRVGTLTEPDIYTAGFGISYNFVTFDYSINIHQILGNTHSISIQTGF